MGKFYRNRGHIPTRLGSCENGTIYRDSGVTWERIGTHENGHVYDCSYNLLGTYENGHVYNRSLDLLGTYENGCVYDRNYNLVYTYDGSSDGADAAACLLMCDEPVSFADSMPDVPPITVSESSSGCGGGSGFVGVFLGLLGGLLIPFSFGLIWWAILKATGPAETPFLVILASSIVFGLFLGIVIFRIRDLISLYLTTVIIASIINIIASFFTSPGYSIFLILLIPPIVVALASAIPTLLAFIAVGLIRKSIGMGRKRRSDNV